MSESQFAPQKPSLWVRFWRFLVRFIFIMVIGILLGALLYWGAPTLYRQYIQPVQIHSMQIEALGTRMDLLEKYSNDQFTSYLARIQTLETRQDKDKEQIAALESQLDRIEAKSATQQAQLEIIDDLTQQISEQGGQLEEIQKTQALLDSASLEIQKHISTLEEQLADQASEIEAIATVAYSKDVRWDSIQLDLQMLQAMELLNRARFNLSQGKLSQAQADIQAANSLLAAVQNQTIEGQTTFIQPVLDYLESAITNLPDNPVSSADNLEGAWELLRQVLPVMDSPQPALNATPEPTTGGAPTVTPTPTP